MGKQDHKSNLSPEEGWNIYLLIQGISRVLYIHRAHVHVFVTYNLRFLPRPHASINTTDFRASPQLELPAPVILAITVHHQLA